MGRLDTKFKSLRGLIGHYQTHVDCLGSPRTARAINYSRKGVALLIPSLGFISRVRLFKSVQFRQNRASKAGVDREYRILFMRFRCSIKVRTVFTSCAVKGATGPYSAASYCFSYAGLTS